jgi:hypothetical protein
MLDELKNYLDVTWSDEGTDAKLNQILERAKVVLQEYACGYEIDYTDTANLAEKQLLFDCCRYIWNLGYEDFAANFTGELIRLRAKYQVLASESEGSE